MHVGVVKARLHQSFSAPGPEPDSAFRVVIAYEDYAAGRSAMDTYHLLLSRFGRELDFRISIWPFEVLQGSRFDAAVRDAVVADAIIVATHRRDGLPEPVQNWVDGWTARKEGRVALLIALFDGPPGASFPMHDYFKSAAGRAGIDFLANRIESERDRSQAASVFTRTSREGPEGWGLND